MPDDTQAPEVDPTTEAAPAPAKKAARKAAAKKATTGSAPTRRAAAKKTAAAETPADPFAAPAAEVPADEVAAADEPVEAVEAADPPAKKTATRKTAAKKTPAKKATAKAATKRASKKTAAAEAPELPLDDTDADQTLPGAVEAPEAAPAEPVEAAQPAAGVPVVRTRTRKSATKRTRTSAAAEPADAAAETDAALSEAPAEDAPGVPAVLFQAPDPTDQPAPADASERTDTRSEPDAESEDDDASAEGDGDGSGRRRRRRGGRRRRKSGDGGSDAGDDNGSDQQPEAESGQRDRSSDDKQADQKQADQKQADQKQADSDDAGSDDSSGEGTSRRRRRRRRGDDGGEGSEAPEKSAPRARRGRTGEDQITAVSGSTRLEAKKQRRREGREAGRRRAPIVSEAEFLARRESVDRVMVVRQRDDLTQIGVLEDKVLVEHYVSRESQTSLIGNVYLGRVQNVLPSMEAAFIDIGRGRNAVLYAGEVNWSALGHKDGQVRKIESVLSSGQTVLVQVTKDPIGHKGARLTSQISLAGRFLVYVPDGTTSGISRKLPDTERNRLKTLLKEIVPDTAGVIVRTAAEGASEEELTRDVERLKERFAEIEKKTKGSAPQLLYGEPDLTVKVVRDLFTEDFARLVIQGDDAWDTVQGYVSGVAPDLEERLERYEPGDHGGADLFAAYRVDEQIAKALDRKVWLPSGGSLIIDRTEAMTVVDVNTGKFTGSGGNLEETVTKNNLEAAEEVVRQLRLRDIGGIIVVDFIDMVLESNRDLVLRRMVECLGRDRTRHQVAEVTSLGLIQMTRKRIGTGLLEAFSENCEHCGGRGLITHQQPVDDRRSDDEPRRSSGRRSRGGRGRGQGDGDGESTGAHDADPGNGNGAKMPSPREFAAMARHRDGEDASEDALEGDEIGTVEAAVEADAAVDAVVDAVIEAAEDAIVDTAVVDAPIVETDAELTVDADLETAAVADAVAEAVAESAVDPVTQAAAEPAAAASDAVADAPTEVVTEPEPPRVVTRTRRRSASRPAGPPTPVAAGDSVDEVTGEVTGEVADETVGEAAGGAAGDPDDAGASFEHVPVKRRGARKR